MPIKTINDLRNDSLPVSTDAHGNLSCGPTGNTVWAFPLGAIVVVWLLLTLLHPPLIVVVLLNVAVTALNIGAIFRVGVKSVPIWVWAIVVLQALQTLRDLTYLARW